MASHAVGPSRKLLELFVAACFAREDSVSCIDESLGLLIPTSLLTLRRLVFVQSDEHGGELLLFLVSGLTIGYFFCQAAFHGRLHDFFDGDLLLGTRGHRQHCPAGQHHDGRDKHLAHTRISAACNLKQDVERDRPALWYTIKNAKSPAPIRQIAR